MKFAIFNLEQSTSVSVLSNLVAEIESQNPDFVVFTNVWTEKYFLDTLIKRFKGKGWVTDPLPKGPVPKCREVLFRKDHAVLAEKVKSTLFDGTSYGFRTYVYYLHTGVLDENGENKKKVIIKTFTLEEDIEPYKRKIALTKVLEGDANLLVPEVVLSDFRVMDWEEYPVHAGWVDIYDEKGGPNEDSNYDQSRRDRIWFRENTAEALSLTSVDFDQYREKLAGTKKMTIAILDFLN